LHSVLSEQTGRLTTLC